MSVDDTRNPAFLRLWAAESVSKAGDAVTLVAVPLVAVVALDAGPRELAILGAAQLIPVVLLSLPVGAWIDGRSSPRRVMVAADLLRALVILSIPVAAVVGRLQFEHLVLAVGLAAALGTWFDLAFAAYLPALVGRASLVVANARLETSRSASLVIGPGAAAAVIGLLSAPIALVLDGLSFLASALLLGFPGRGAATGGRPQGPPPARRSILAGVAFAVREPHLRAITATAMTNNFSRSIGMVVVFVFLIDGVGHAAADVALALALGNAGFVAGAVLSARLSGVLGVGRTMRLGVSLFWPGMLGLALAPPDWSLVAFTVMVLMNGFGIAVHNVNQVSVRQSVTPDGRRASVTAASRLLIMGALPAGTLVGGLLGETIGLRPTLVIAAVGLFAGSLPYRIGRVGRLQVLPEPVPAGG